jgi:hypothetical protein
MLLTRASLWGHGGPASLSVHSTDCLASRDRISHVTPKQEVLQSYNFVALVPRLPLILASRPGLIPSNRSNFPPMHRPPRCGVTQLPVQWAFSAGLSHSFRRKPLDRLSGGSPRTELIAQRCPNSAVCPIQSNKAYDSL